MTKKSVLFVSFLFSIMLIFAQPAINIEDMVKADAPVKLLNHNQVMQAVGFPEKAKAEKASGKVVLRVEFDEKGNYASHTVKESAHPLLLEAVEAQIKNIKATPAKLNGKPIRFSYNVPFKFNLMGGDVIETLNFEEVREKIGYPEKAKKKGIKGAVIIAVMADEKGNVTDFKTLASPDKSLTEAVEKNIILLKFKPAMKDSVPATFRTQVRIEFE